MHLNIIFLFLAHFQHSLGPVKMRIKIIHRHSDVLNQFNTIEQLKSQTEQPIFNNPFQNIIDSICNIETGFSRYVGEYTILLVT